MVERIHNRHPHFPTTYMSNGNFGSVPGIWATGCTFLVSAPLCVGGGIVRLVMGEVLGSIPSLVIKGIFFFRFFLDLWKGFF